MSDNAYAYVVDMGTTGIVFAKSNGTNQDVVVSSAALNAQNNLTVKVPTTLHIFEEQGKDIFDESTILQRAYFGEPPVPSTFASFTRAHKGVEYTFHGLKTYVYKDTKQMPATNDKKKLFDANRIFVVALRLLRVAIEKSEKNNKMPDFYKIVFLVPANSECNLLVKLKGLIIQVFNEITPDKIKDQIFFIKEPVAATLFAATQLKAQGIAFAEGVQVPHVAIFDLGGGTCDFNLALVNQKDFNSSTMKTNNGCFAGGFNVDIRFTEFVEMMLPEASPQEKDKYLLEFMKKKVVYPFTSFTFDFPEGFKDDVDEDEFIQRLDNPFTGLYVEDKLKEMYDTGEFEVTKELMKFCFDSVYESLNKSMKDFMKAACAQGEIHNVIMVGGFAQSKLISETLTANVLSEYQRLSQQFGYNNQIVVNRISQQSLAIIKGGTKLFEVCGGDFGELRKRIVNPVNANVFFCPKDQTPIQIFTQGQGMENIDQNVPQLSNITAVDQSAKEAVARFFFSSEVDKVKKEENKVFLINVSERGPFEFRLSIQQGAELFVNVRGSKDVKTYQAIDEAELEKKMKPAVEQPTLYFLTDTTYSMEPFVKELRLNMGKVLEVIGKHQFTTRLVYYSDYTFTNNADKAEATKASTDLETLQKSMEKKEHDIQQQQGQNNDMTENLLPAFEEVICDRKVKNKVIVLIGDCCAHTHIGCECVDLPKIGPKDPEDVRKAEVDRLYGCEKCKKDFAGADWVLKDDIKIQDHRRRWELACQQLRNIPIIFVPVQQPSKLKIRSLDELNSYAFSGYSILKTQRMMKLMGCQNVKTVDAGKIDQFVENLVKVVEIQIAELTIVQ